MIQFPNGQSPLPLVPENLGADLLRAVARVHNVAEMPATPGDTISVQSVHAALELDLLSHLAPGSAAAGSADYQLARAAAVASEPVISLQHLEQAVQQSPVYAAVALEDPAFKNMRGPVQELADHVSFAAGNDPASASGTYQPPRGPQAALPASDAPAPPEQTVVRSLPTVFDTVPDPAAKPLSFLWSQPAGTARGPLLAQTYALPDQPIAASPRQQPPSPLPGRSAALPPQLQPILSALPRAVSALLDLELLRSWDTEPARAIAANEYQLARTAIEVGDRPAALQHIEQAILAHPAQAAAVQADPAFDAIRGPVREVVARLAAEARTHAEASIAEARVVLQSLGLTSAARPLQLAQAYLAAAQAAFQLGIYTGYVQAAFAAELAQQIAKGKLSPAARSWAAGAFAPAGRAVKQAVRRLWQRLPLLAILLGWFLTGIGAAAASLPFENGAAFRAWLLPVWAIGLVAFVLFGFIRSIRRAH